jgi:hypothetical protein
MIGVRLEQAKAAFLEAQKIMEAEGKATQKNLARFGAFTRRTAKGLIRPGKKPSQPGNPPHSHTGKYKENIFFVVTDAPPNVVIGPILLNAARSQMSLAALERGGQSTILNLRWLQGRRTYVPRTILVKARPAMQPAFDKELPGAAKLWENTVK